jgi:threonylcarbamoyladenosine tRNA methylthiotransferase MtaB
MATVKNRKRPTVAVTTLGCKVNQYESAALETGFQNNGFSLVDFSQPADIYVINTCAVTAKAGAQSRQLIRRAQRTNPTARFVITGCYAQIASENIRDLVGNSGLLVGNGQKHLLVDTVCGTLYEKQKPKPELLLTDIGSDRGLQSLTVGRFGSRTRAFLKVQDGCDNFCSYCIVPYARGRSRSQLPADIFTQAEAFAREGHKELVITGIHVGDYGRDLQPQQTLLDLITALVKRTPQIRYRLSSLEPTEISDRLLRTMAATPTIMPHLHIPLQSGDNTVLKKMNRRYTAEDFRRIVEMILLWLPDAAMGIDVLVGFPGEDEKAFNNTLHLLQQLPVAYLHVFPYSKRPGTPAAAMAGQVVKKIKEERVAELRELDNKKRIAFYKSQVGKIRRVLAEKSGGIDRRTLKGFTENYIPVHFDGPAHLGNQVVKVRLDKVIGRQVVGTVAGEEKQLSIKSV